MTKRVAKERSVAHKQRKAISRLLPAGPGVGGYPDFAKLRRQIFGGKKARKTGTAQLSQERGNY